MWKHRMRTILGGLALVMSFLIVLPGQTQATPPGGVVGTPLVRGSFTDDVGVKFKLLAIEPSWPTSRMPPRSPSRTSRSLPE